MRAALLALLFATAAGAQGYRPNVSLQLNTQRVTPDLIITPYSVVAQAASGQAAFRVAQTGARIYFDVGGNIYVYSDGSQVVSASAWAIPSLSVDTIGTYTSSRNKVEIFYPQPYPLGSLASCSSGFKGRLETLSTDGRTYACDGTTTQRVAYSLTSAATSLDYGSISSHATETLTITLTGATTADVPLCRPTGGSSPTTDIDIHEYVSAADTISLVAHNDSGGNVDPPATTYTCVIVR